MGDAAHERSECGRNFLTYFGGIMARTYIPTTVIEVHKVAKFAAKYQAFIRPAVVAINPAYGAVFDDLLSALLAFDAISQSIYPLES